MSIFDKLNRYWAEIADTRATEKETDFIENIVETRALVLDLCCGTGRHSILLSKRGLKIIGLDLSPNLLKIARKNMIKNGAAFPIIRGEMQYLPFREEVFEVTINMFTSFGYLPSEKEDIRSLKEILRTLKQNGLFLLDIANREHLLQVFKRKDWGEFPSFYMRERRTLDLDGTKLHSEWILIDKSTREERIFSHNLRLYKLPQLKKMFEDTGFVIESIYGDYENRNFDPDSQRLIILARRKESLY